MSTYDWRNDPNLNQDQKEAFARAERLHGGSKDTDAPEGFLSSGYNAVARGLSNLRNIPTVSMAEDFSALAEQNQDLTERAASGELSFLERLYYGKNYGRSDEQIDQTQGLAAEYAGAAAQRQSDAYANYPMSERGRVGLQALQQSETFKDVGSAILADPLGVASGVAQVAVEQAPTIAASAVASRLGSPGAGISLFGASGFTQERYGQLINEAAEAGYDLNNPDQARAAIEDREFMQRQAERGFTRGVIIGAVDLLTMGLASKTPLTLKGVGTNTGIQIVGGGTGEAAAELADTGEINPGEIAIEALAEGVTAPVDVAALGLGRNSETNLDSDAAAAQTADELALLAQQEAEQQEANDLAVAQEQSRKEMLQRNVDFFPAREDYVAERKKARVADLDDTTSELHNTYRQWKMENNLLLKNGSKEDNAAKKQFLKETTPENETEQLHAEHEQALEAFAIEREAAPAPQVNPAQDKELPSPIDISKADGRRKAPTGSEKLGLAASASSTIIPPSASTAAMEAQVQGELPSPLVVGEDGLMQAGPLVPQLAPEITRAVEAARLKDAGKAPKVKAGTDESSKPAPVAVPEADPAAIKVYSQKTATAKVEALAAAKALPDDWSSAFPELDSALNAAKFKIKPFNEALEAALNPQAAPEVTDTPVNTLAEEGTTEEAAPTITDPKALKLSEAQTRINKVLDDHFTGDKQFALEEVYAGGEFLTENIAKLAGVQSKQHVATSIDRFKTKFLEAQGLLKPRASKAEKDAAVAKFSRQLKEQAEAAKQDRIKASQAAATEEDAAADISQTADTAEQNVDGSITETVDRDPNSAENLGDVSDDGEGSASIFAEVGIDSTVASVGQGNYTGVDAEDKVFTQSQTTTDEEVAAQAAEQNDRNIDRNIEYAMQEVDATLVFSEWDALKQDGTPDFKTLAKEGRLSRLDRYLWMMSVLEYQDSGRTSEDLQQLTADLRGIEESIQESANETNNAESNQGSATKSAEQTDEARAPPAGREGQGSDVSSSRGADTSQDGETTGVQGAAQTAPVVERRQRKVINSSAQKKQKRRANNAINAQQFKDSYNSSSLDDMKSNPALAEVVKFADYLNSLTDAQWAKITPTFDNAKNPFKAPSMDVEQIRGFIDNTLNEPDAPKKPGTRFSLFKTRNNTTTKEAIVDAVQKLFGNRVPGQRFPVLVDDGQGAFNLESENEQRPLGDLYSPIQVYDTLEDAIKGTKGRVPRAQLERAQAFIDPDDNRRIHLIAEHIEAGTEAAVLMHEAGVHLGLEGEMTGKQLETLADVVTAWETQPENTVENKVYKAAMARVAFARMTGMEENLNNVELIAYAVEEAVNLGVKPTGMQISIAEQWLSDINDFFVGLLTRMRVVANPISNEAQGFIPAMNAQQLVALARGSLEGVYRAALAEPGALPNAKPKRIALYYSGAKSTIRSTRRGVVVTPKSKKDGGRSPLNPSTGTITGSPVTPGEEIYDWEPDAKFGPLENVFTMATEEDYSGTGIDGFESLKVELFSQDVNIPGAIVTAILKRNEGVGNSYDAIIQGPQNPDLEKLTGIRVTDAPIISGGDTMPRLEGVSMRQNLRFMREVRRRLTRMNGGVVPNITATRITGAAATNDIGFVTREYDYNTIGQRYGFKDLTGNDFDVDPKPKTGSREVFEKLTKELTGKSTNWRVKVFDNESDIVAQRILKNLGGDALANVKSGASFGWVSEDSNGTTTAHFILSNIAAGGERAAFMHEVGSHLGIDQMVDAKTRARLELKVNEWASQNDNSLESIISKKALERVQNAAQADKRMAKDPEIVTSETLAYFLEEATAMGVEPSVKTPIGRLLRELYALFKKALRKIKYNTDNLTAQDVVDLAQGAARISLRARKHGATADFRRFNHAYMGMGEGAQAYGWGTYLAERFSIARWYLRQDEKRKGKARREAALSDPSNPLNKRIELDDMPPVVSEVIQKFNPPSRNTIGTAAEVKERNAPGWHKPPLEPPRIEFRETADDLTETIITYPTRGGTRVSFNVQSVVFHRNVPSQQDVDKHAEAQTELRKIQEQASKDVAAYRKEMGVEGNMVFVDSLVEDKDMMPWGSEIYKKPAIEERLTKMFLSLPPIDAFDLLDYIFHKSPVLSDPNTSDITSRMNEIKKRHDPLLLGNPTLFDANNPGSKADKDRAKAALTSDLTDFLGETFMSATGADVYRGMELALKVHPRSSAMLSNMADQLSDKSKSKPAFRGKNSFSGQEDMVISMMMDDFGVKGIIFPDAGTLGATSADQGLAYNNVVFDEDNLIVIGRAPGKSVSNKKNTVDEIRYGIKESWAAKTQGPKVKPFLTNAKFIAKAGTRSLKFLHQIVDQSREKMPAVGRWYDGMLAAEATRNEIRRSFEDIAVRATNLDPARLDAVNNFIDKSTFFQKWAYDPEIKGRTVKIDPIMKRIFEGLNENEQQLAKDVFAHGENMRQRKIAIAKALGVDKKFFTEAALEGPYAPLKRPGNFAGELKSQQLLDAENKRDALDPKAVTKELRAKIDKLKSDPDHYAISFFDTPGAAEQFVDANRDKYAFGEWSEREADIESDRIGNPAVYEKVLGALQAGNNSAIPADAKKAFQDLVKNLYFQSLDERSARLSGSRRMNRAGYDKNMMRSFLSHARAEASLISQMENGATINAALAEARPSSGARKEEIDTYNMIVKHYKDTLNQVDTPIQDRIAAANSVYMLTTSVGYHLTNATQPIMVTVPRIAGNFNDYTGTWAALFKGYGVARNIIDGSFFNQVKTAVTVGLVGTNQVGINIEKAPPEYRRLLEYLQLHQLLDVGMEEDLGNLDKFDFGYDSINKASDFLGGMTHRLYQVARYVEAHNRVSSAIAAYDMAKKNPNVMREFKMTPLEYATAVVQDTQGNFSRLDAPLLLKALPKVTVQYRKYQFLMAWHYTDAFNQGFRDESPAVRASGKRILRYSLAHAGLTAGATGIPMLGSIYWALTTLLGDEDEPEDLERYIRSKIEDENLADVLSRGLPAFLGVDMSTKLSQGKIFQPLPYVDFEASEDGIKDVWFGLLGPVGTTAANFTRAAGYMEKGDMLKAIEYSVPKGVRSATETFRLATEGFSLSNGDVVIDPREINIGSLMINAMGLPSTEINKIKWTRGQQFELMEYFNNESSRLRREYVDARRDRDRAKQKSLREEWRELQVSKERIRPFFNNERGTLKRQPVSDLMKASRRQSKREDKSRKQLTGN